jgi:hypothetical protein
MVPRNGNALKLISPLLDGLESGVLNHPSGRIWAVVFTLVWARSVTECSLASHCLICHAKSESDRSLRLGGFRVVSGRQSEHRLIMSA